jgi:hypothetical protein
MAITASYLRYQRGRTDKVFEYAQDGMRVLGSYATAQLFANNLPSARLEEVGDVLFRNSLRLMGAARELQRLQEPGKSNLEKSMRELLEERVRLVSSRFAQEYRIFSRGFLGRYLQGTAYLRISQGLDELAETHSHEAGHGLVEWLGLSADEVMNEAYPILLERHLNNAGDIYCQEPYRTASRLVTGLELACGPEATLAQKWSVLMRYPRNDSLASDLKRGRITVR